MALLEILKFPDPRLRRKAKHVPHVDDELKQLAQDMLETMYAEKGIGLASIQVGVEKSLLVIDTRVLNDTGRYDETEMTDREKEITQPIIIYNPVLKKKEGKTTFDEGCLSVPGYYETVERFKYVEVEGLDKKGEPLLLKLDGLLSICMQHEMDHLEGKVFLDRLSPIKSMRLKNKIKKHGYPTPGEDNEEEE